jgi:hypothetical protein
MGEKTEVEEPMRHEANLQHWTSTEEPRGHPKGIKILMIITHLFFFMKMQRI